MNNAINIKNTKKLEKMFQTLIKEIEISEELKIETITRFMKGSLNDIEGIYAFYMDGKYHYTEIKRGEISLNRSTNDIREVIYWILKIELFNISLSYARVNDQLNKDFRRELFKKELDLFKIAGEYYFNKKEKEIEEILSKNPYNDI